MSETTGAEEASTYGSSFYPESEKTFTTTYSVLSDYRALWIREKILQFLGLGDAYKLFNDLMNNNNHINEEKLFKFLNTDTYETADLECKQVFFYKTYRDEVVQEEVSIWEEGRAKIAAMGSFAAQVKSRRQKSSADDKRKKGKSSKKSKKPKKPSKGAKVDRSDSLKDEEDATIDNVESSTALRSNLSIGGESDEFDYEEGGEDDDDIETQDAHDEIYAMLMKEKSEPSLLSSTIADETLSFIPPPGQEHKYILTRKVVDRVIQTPVLHCFFGEINGSDADLEQQRLVYILRTSESSIPIFDAQDDCWAEMPRHVIVGSLQGKFLPSMGQILKQVFLPLAEKQFRGPEAAQDKAAHDALQAMVEMPGIERAAETLCDLSKSQGPAFMPPSNIRRVSLHAEKMQCQIDQAAAMSGAGDGPVSSRPRTSRKSEEKVEKRIEPSKLEFLQYLTKLIESVEWTLDHIEGDTLLTVPDIFENIDPEMPDRELANSNKLVEHLEEVVLSWEKHIKKVVDSYVNKSPQSKGPIAEYTFWHDRESGLSLLVEQLRSPSILRILNILYLAESAIGSGFQYYAQEINQYYYEAKENNKFLLTVLRYFKIIAESDSFNGISHAIPLLYEHLRMIWVLSKYYSTEERMVSLLERISWQLKQNVMKNLAIRHLFDEPLEIILDKTNAAHKMLKLWKAAYLDTRSSIELSGKGARWEFEQRRLFKDTDYLATVSANLHEIAGVLRDFYNIFGEQLKSIVDDPARIDSIVERVDQLLVPIKAADNDAFNEFNRESWDATMSWFRGEVERLEKEAEVFIDECFTALIKAEDALSMLMKFRNMKTREAVQRRLALKFDVIMQQFSKEIGEVESIFNRGKKKPPLLRYHPPIAGSIYWERQLFLSLKGPVMTFQEIDELQESDLREFAFEQYAALGKQMKSYEDAKFEEYVSKAQSVLHKNMRRNVLTLQQFERKEAGTRHTQSKVRVGILKKTGSDYVSTTGTVMTLSRADDRMSYVTTHKLSLGSRLSINPSLKTVATFKSVRTRVSRTGPSSATTITEKLQQQIMKNTELMRGAILLENQVKLTVNFNSLVFDMIREAELLEHLGFELPPMIREVGIQKRRLHEDREAVEKMINQYNDIIEKFDEADALLLKNTLENVEKHIQPGVTRLNWYSLGINDYASACTKLLKSLSSTVDQVNQIRNDLDKQIDSELGRYNLFTTKDDPDEPGYELLGCKAFFTEVESKRTELVSAMLKCYQATSPMLVKLESLVEATATGKSPAMLLYYERYEQGIFSALINCFIKNLEHFRKRLVANKPMFQVNATLFTTEVVLKPSSNEIYTTVLRDIKDLMEQVRVFPRWMARSCLECKPIKESATDFVTFSFFEDVMGVQIINELIFSVQETSHRLANDCWRYLVKWKQYSNLWSLDKTQVCEKFVASNPTLQQYDEKFGFYDSIIEEIDEMTDFYDVCSIRINLQPLLNGIKNHARDWKQVLGNFLQTETSQAMNDLDKMIEKFRSDVELVINGLERFKIVMQCINDVKRMAIQAEVKYSQYQETYKILRSHKVDYQEADEDKAHRLQSEWESLYLGALYRFHSLESTKDQFCDMTVREIEEFGSVISEFVERFHQEGPGSCGDDLDSGMKRMDTFGAEMIKLEQKLQDLTNAELLFDLPPADYKGFYQVRRDYDAMTQLFTLYQSQKTARDVWAKTLWADLNPQQLIDGMDGYLKEFRKMPKAVRSLAVGKALENSMKSFKNSVPLFVELKNEAMRERHWKELMDRTGKHFDMSPDRFGSSSDRDDFFAD